MSSSIVFCVLICACVGVTIGYSILHIAETKRDIPQRCIDHSVTNVSCAGVGSDSLLPHPDDCQLFYYCVGGEYAPVCRQCPADLHFSPTEHVCATADVAGCDLIAHTSEEPKNL